jgi:LacI family transcriptional regulator
VAQSDNRRPEGQAMPRMSDVATMAGVSLGTVSNALNHPDRLSPVTLKRIRRVIKELGFVRNGAAQSLARGISNTIGFVIIDLSNSFFLDMSRGAEQAAAEAGFSLILANSDMDMARQDSHLDLFDQQRTAGVLLAPLPGLFSGLERARQHGQPVVLLNAAPQQAGDYCAVLTNNEHGGYLAARHLIEQGCRQLAFCGNIDALPPIRQRYSGAVRAVAQTNGAVRLELIPTPEVQVGDGLRVGHQVVEREPALRPDGIIAGADLLAAGIVQTILSQSDLRFPEDVSIIGYDDNRSAWNALIPLSTLAQPGLEMGRLAAQSLIDEITARDHRHRQIVLEPQLVVRDSSRRLAKT